MSEEKEAKKGIEWLKEEMDSMHSKRDPDRNPNEWFISKSEMLEAIDQLDEPEASRQIDKLANFIMSEVAGEPSQSQGAVDTAIRIIKSYQNQEALSQKWLDENKSSWVKLKVDGYYIPVEKLQNLLVPKQESPVVPELVADHIQSSKDMGLTLYTAMENVIEDYGNKINDWLWDGPGDDSFQVFAKAWLAYPNIVVEERELTVKEVIEEHIELLKKQEVAVNLKPYYDLWEELKDE